MFKLHGGAEAARVIYGRPVTWGLLAVSDRGAARAADPVPGSRAPPKKGILQPVLGLDMRIPERAGSPLT